MTIKHFNKNISAEKKNILTNVTLNNDLLTFTVEDLFEDGQTRLKNPIEINLERYKLKLKIVTSTRLTELSASTNPNDVEERESFIFLVPFQSDEEGTYREYIWIVENEGQQNESGKFEVIGSTRIDLTNCIQKSNTAGLIRNDGTVDQTNYLTMDDFITHTLRVEYSDGTTEIIDLLSPQTQGGS